MIYYYWAEHYAFLVHRQAGIYLAIFYDRRTYVSKKILSIFIDESGDFGKYDIRSPYYYVAMVFHDQSIDISSDIDMLNEQIQQIGFHNHAIHSGPLIRREQVYKYELMEKRQMLFRALFHFTRKLDIKYICPKINKSECNDDIFAYIAKLSKTIADELKNHYQYFKSQIFCVLWS